MYKISKLIGFLFLLTILFSKAAFAVDKRIGKTFYTRATLWADQGEISSVNYKIGDMIPVGTEVKLVHMTDETVEFRLNSTEDEFIIRIDPRMSFLDPDQLFRRYFDQMSPEKTGIFKVFTDDEIAAIKKGEVIKGMSKAALIMSYGYPPSHKTDIERDNTWTYWLSPSEIQIITFKDGALVEIYPTPGQSVLKETKAMPKVKMNVKFFDRFDNEILKAKREEAKKKYEVIPSELSYSEVLNDSSKLEVLELRKVVDDLPLGGSIDAVASWCREQGVSTIENRSLAELKSKIYELLIPVGVEKDKLNKWGYGAIAHSLKDSASRLNHNQADVEKAKKLFGEFNRPKLVYYGNTFFLDSFKNLKYGKTLSQDRYYLIAKDSPKFSKTGINKVVFYFERNFSDYRVYAIEVFFSITPDEYIEKFDDVYSAHDLIPGDPKLGVKQWFDDYVASILLDPVPSDLLSYIWGANLFLIPDATLHEYNSTSVDFYRTRLFNSYFLESIGLVHRNHYRIVFVEDSFAEKTYKDAN